MKNKQVLVVRCKCGKTIIQAGDPASFTGLKRKRELGELAMNGHKIETISYAEYRKLDWYCKDREGKKPKSCTEKEASNG